MINVWGWSADSAGCQAYRIRWVADALNELYPDTVDYRFGSGLSKSDREWANVIIGQRVVLPGPSHFWQKFSRDPSKRLVLDMDDDLFRVEENNYRASAVFNKSDVQQRLRDNIRASDLVTVSTPFLKKSVHDETGYPLDQIVVIRNALPPELVLPEVPELDLVKRPLLGWLGSPTHAEDFRSVTRELGRFLENNPHVTFHTIGSDYASWMKLPEDQCVHTPWIKSPETAIKSIDYRVGIAPLRSGVFNASKSDCKALETSARGVPAILADVRAYDTFTDGENCLKSRGPYDWGKRFKELCFDSARQRELAVNAHAYVRDNRTTHHTAPEWLEAITG